jgi:YegS/Rv2252/BmrU family lipid kinase
MKELLFIVNPAAGNGTALGAIPLIEQFCKQCRLKYEIIKTQYKGHATALAKSAVSLSYDAVVAVGGDGTVMEVANGLVGSLTPLGILPTGTGNDLSKSLNIPSKIDKALSIIAYGKPKYIDAVSYGNGYFFNVASIGFDAEIARDIQKIKRWISGKTAYYVSALLKFITYRHKDVVIEIDNTKISTKILLFAIANGTYYGGGMNVNPNGSIDDGYIDAILITPVPRFKFPFLFWKFVSGKYLDLPYVKAYRCKKVKIHSDESLPVNGDGDIIATTPVQFSVSDHGILVFC